MAQSFKLYSNLFRFCYLFPFVENVGLIIYLTPKEFSKASALGQSVAIIYQLVDGSNSSFLSVFRPSNSSRRKNRFCGSSNGESRAGRPSAYCIHLLYYTTSSARHVERKRKTDNSGAVKSLAPEEKDVLVVQERKMRKKAAK